MAEIGALQPEVAECLVAQVTPRQRRGEFPRRRSEEPQPNGSGGDITHMHGVRCRLPQVIDIDVAVHADEKVALATSHDGDVAQDAGLFVEHQTIGDRTRLLTQITGRYTLKKLQRTVACYFNSFQGRDIEQADAIPDRARLSTDDRRPEFCTPVVPGRRIIARHQTGIGFVPLWSLIPGCFEEEGTQFFLTLVETGCAQRAWRLHRLYGA